MQLILSYKYQVLRFLILSYFFFILFDGILRKWILPSLSTPIMGIKQGIAVLIVIFGLLYIKKFSLWEYSFAVIGVIVYITSILAGHGNHIVALYGCLPYWFGLPVCYIIGKTLLSKDIILINKIIIITSLFNSLLVIIQYVLPSGHILNFQGGIVEENIYSFSAADLAGGFRPAGIFIHNTHNTLFSCLSISITFYYLFHQSNSYSRSFLVTIIVLDFIASICSVSRMNMILHIALIIYILLITNKRYYKQIIISGCIILPLSIVIVNSKIGEKTINNIGNRFESAAMHQFNTSNILTGTIMDIYNRNIKYNIDAITNPKTTDGADISFWGYGQGLSTQVGSKILGLTKHSGFTLAEWDGLRIMCESGIFLGWIIIIIRLGYVLRYFPFIYKCIKKNILLPLILYPSFFISFYLIMTWGNLFIANFAFFTGGLFIAVINNLKRYLHRHYFTIKIDHNYKQATNPVKEFKYV